MYRHLPVEGHVPFGTESLICLGVRLWKQLRNLKKTGPGAEKAAEAAEPEAGAAAEPGVEKAAEVVELEVVASSRVPRMARTSLQRFSSCVNFETTPYARLVGVGSSLRISIASTTG